MSNLNVDYEPDEIRDNLSPAEQAVYDKNVAADIRIIMSDQAIRDRLVGPWDGEGWDEGMDEVTRLQRINMMPVK
jgi:hypothetical protein